MPNDTDENNAILLEYFTSLPPPPQLPDACYHVYDSENKMLSFLNSGGEVIAQLSNVDELYPHPNTIFHDICNPNLKAKVAEIEVRKAKMPDCCKWMVHFLDCNYNSLGSTFITDKFDWSSLNSFPPRVDGDWVKEHQAEIDVVYV